MRIIFNEIVRLVFFVCVALPLNFLFWIGLFVYNGVRKCFWR